MVGPSGTKPQARLQVGYVRAVPQVYVPIVVQASDAALFVPYCGELEGGEKVLCTAGTHLEVRTSSGWRNAGLRKTYGVLGASALGSSGGRVIESQSKATFTYEFSRRYFLVEPGQSLRVVVDVWADEKSMKSGVAPTQLTSPPFVCPQSGTGQ